MNTQQIFDKVAAHLLTQNEQSRIPVISDSLPNLKNCAYRSPEGLSCAVGCLIAPEAYSEYLEGQAATSEPVKIALRASGIAVDLSLESLLSDLQQLHDHNSPEEWPQLLRSVAEEHGLTYQGATE